MFSHTLNYMRYIYCVVKRHNSYYYYIVIIGSSRMIVISGYMSKEVTFKVNVYQNPICACELSIT